MYSVPAVAALHSDGRGGDSSQAQYFRRLLDAERAQLDDKIVKDLRKLAALSGVNEAVGVKALRRRVRVMQRQRQELDRLIRALDCRFHSAPPVTDAERSNQSLRCTRPTISGSGSPTTSLSLPS